MFLVGLLALNHITENLWPIDVARLDLIRSTALDQAEAVGQPLHLVLERLGFLTMTDDGVDLEQTQLYSYASPNRSLTKKIRFALAGRDPGGQVPVGQRSVG